MAEELEIDVAGTVGASEEPSSQVLTLYIPDRDQDGALYGKQEEWCRKAAELLVRIGGGVTRWPPCEGGWANPNTGAIVWEQTVLLYTYVRGEAFVAHLEDLRDFLHSFGRETNQGEVVFEFASRFYRIKEYVG